jgi:hypothetical protein
MKSLVSIALGFAAFGGIVLAITPVVAQTSAVMAHARENVTKSRSAPAPRRPQAITPSDRVSRSSHEASIPLPSPRFRGSSAAAGDQARERHRRADALRLTRAPFQMAQCPPDDRKCEVERKLKGLVSDPGF